MNLKISISTIVLLLFVGCGTVQVEENNDDNSSSNITETINDITNNNTSSIETIVTPETVENRTILEEPSKDYKAKFINENNCNQILDKEFLVICYDYKLKVAKAVAYTLEGDLVNELNIKDRPYFYEEELIDEPYRAKLNDYRGSGYDKGHMAPDAAFDWSQESLEATYSLANIIPQVPEVNQHMWVDVEAYARSKAVELGEVDVVNVIKYDNNNPKYIGEDNVAVSVGYYKILFNEDESYEECFYYANDINSTRENDNLSKHKVDCNNIVTK
ncbi:MAG: DNA/RNA non-specific endonuclease [Epsilonproteobacteria bacterium]|nr:DNA/RNA non-specific endonuclease [Campylobacterota bacterium]